MPSLMDNEHYEVAIVGAGPAGLSAAARAAHYDRELGTDRPQHILLEESQALAKTIRQYQKGKHVMDEPGYLDLRSELPFNAGTREATLERWLDAIESNEVNVRYDAKVVKVAGERGGFVIALADGGTVAADHVVLAIGTQGNPRLLGVDGDHESDFVTYTLDDPAAFGGQTIVVVGGGDSAIENAIALSADNAVHMVNRRAEFIRAKDANLSAILAALNDPVRKVRCAYESTVSELQLPNEPGGLGAVVLNTPTGPQRIECHRVIARLGTTPPHGFLRASGIAIGESGLPELDRRYQSTIAGLYVVGALAGYPLIKQAMNQGYEVVDFIHGKDTLPADYPLLSRLFSGLPYAMDAEDVLELYQQRIPMFRRMNPLAFRELVVESKVIVSGRDGRLGSVDQAQERNTVVVQAGDALYRHGEYSTGFYTLVEGEVRIQLEQDGPWHEIAPGGFFGEMSLISGRPRQGGAVVGPDTILIETPRRIMVKLMGSNEDVRAGIDRIFVLRALQSAFRPQLELDRLLELAGEVETCRYEGGETLFLEGEAGDCLHLIRSGNVALAIGERDRVVAQHRSGELVGQMALMGSRRRRYTALATVRTETLKVFDAQFRALVSSQPRHIERLQDELSASLRQSNAMASQVNATRNFAFLLEEGIGEATNAMVIDETLCIGCDNCERACAETHEGVSRLDRAAGPSFAALHLPITCRHCELPHCMKDCPPDAIRRSANGEVYITDSCIGCGNCESNCPYDAIHMAYEAPAKPGLWSWLLLGRGPGPGEPDRYDPTPAAIERGKKAVKCDACASVAGGPACVRACPTGAAMRVGPSEVLEVAASL